MKYLSFVLAAVALCLFACGFTSNAQAAFQAHVMDRDDSTGVANVYVLFQFENGRADTVVTDANGDANCHYDPPYLMQLRVTIVHMPVGYYFVDPLSGYILATTARLYYPFLIDND